MIVPLATGGTGDTLARLVADKLGEALGQQVMVENRAGANGIIGAEAVAKSAPASTQGRLRDGVNVEQVAQPGEASGTSNRQTP